MKTKMLIFLILIMIFISLSCWNAKDEILPVGKVEIFLDNLIFEDGQVTIFLHFKELAGVESLLMCLMPRFIKDSEYLECGGFSPGVIIPRYGEIPLVQKMRTVNDCRDADVLRIVIQLQTENFEGFHVDQYFIIN